MSHKFTLKKKAQRFQRNQCCDTMCQQVSTIRLIIRVPMIGMIGGDSGPGAALSDAAGRARAGRRDRPTCRRAEELEGTHGHSVVPTRVGVGRARADHGQTISKRSTPVPTAWWCTTAGFRVCLVAAPSQARSRVGKVHLGPKSGGKGLNSF